MINFFKKIVKKEKRELYLLSIIILIAFFLRFYNFPYRYGLGEETVRDAVIGLQGARELQAPLTGSFSSLGPFTFGPWYAYQLIIFSIIFPSNYSPWIYLGLISVAYIFIIYKIGELLEGKRFGLILALLAAFSPAQIISGTHLTSHNNTNLFAVLAIWLFVMIMSKNISSWWAFALGAAIGIGMNLHYQMAGLLILPLLILLFKHRRYVYFLNSVLGVFITFIPLLFFELNNHWFNTRNVVYFFLHDKDRYYVPYRWLFYLRDFWPSFWANALGVPTFVGAAIILLFMVILIYLYSKRKVSFLITLLILAFFFNFFALRYYFGNRYFGYLNFLRPFVFIFTGFVFFFLSKIKAIKFFGIGLLFLTILIGLPKTLEQLNQDPFTLRIYDQVKTLEGKYKNKKFTLYGCSNFYRAGYNPITFSLVFVLDKKHKLSDSGVKIGLKSVDCEYPFHDSLKMDAFRSVEVLEKIYPTLTDIGLIDFSEASEGALLKAGWQPVTFKSVYELNARWWFKEQP